MLEDLIKAWRRQAQTHIERGDNHLAEIFDRCADQLEATLKTLAAQRLA